MWRLRSQRSGLCKCFCQLFSANHHSALPVSSLFSFAERSCWREIHGQGEGPCSMLSTSCSRQPQAAVLVPSSSFSPTLPGQPHWSLRGASTCWLWFLSGLVQLCWPLLLCSLSPGAGGCFYLLLPPHLPSVMPFCLSDL